MEVVLLHGNGWQAVYFLVSFSNYVFRLLFLLGLVKVFGKLVGVQQGFGKIQLVNFNAVVIRKVLTTTFSHLRSSILITLFPTQLLHSTYSHLQTPLQSSLLLLLLLLPRRISPQFQRILFWFRMALIQLVSSLMCWEVF
jgi:hypothetical protein